MIILHIATAIHYSHLPLTFVMVMHSTNIGVYFSVKIKGYLFNKLKVIIALQLVIGIARFTTRMCYLYT